MARKKMYADVCSNGYSRIELFLKIKGQKGKWIKCEGYESIYFDDDEIPAGKYSYYCRHKDKNWDYIESVKKNKELTVNFWGSIVTDTPIDFGENNEISISRMENEEDNGYEVFVVFGEYCARAYMEEGLKGVRRKLDEGTIVKRSFGSKAERDAYIMGIDDADGWMGSAVISTEDILNHRKIIQEML